MIRRAFSMAVAHIGPSDVTVAAALCIYHCFRVTEGRTLETNSMSGPSEDTELSAAQRANQGAIGLPRQAGRPMSCKQNRLDAPRYNPRTIPGSARRLWSSCCVEAPDTAWCS